MRGNEVKRVPGEVYLDLYILVNGSMDLLCLLLSARLCHARTTRWRLFCAASLGGLYAAASLLLGISGVWGLLSDLLAALFMTAIAFWGRESSFVRFFRLSFVVFFVSALLAGLLTLFYRFFNRLSLPLEALSGDSLSVWIFALLGGLAGLLTIKGGRFLGYAGKHREATLTVDFGQGEIKLHALVDTGNLLKDPVSGRGVIVADREKILSALSEPLRISLLQSDPAAWLKTGQSIRLIPAKSATGDRLLPALSPKKLLLDDGKDRYPVDYLSALSELGARASGVDALLPPD